MAALLRGSCALLLLAGRCSATAAGSGDEQHASTATALSMKIKGELNVAEKMLKKELRGHPRTLHLEESLLEKASAAVEQSHRQTLLGKGRAEEHTGARLLMSVAQSERRRASDERKAMDEMNRDQGDVVEALEDVDPRTAVKVEKLLDRVHHQQAALASTEAELAAAVEGIAVPRRPEHHHNHLIQQRRGRTAHAAAVEGRSESGAEMGARLAQFAGVEARLADTDRSNFQAMSKIATQTNEALEEAGVSEDVSHEVGDLLKKATAEQRNIALTEHHEAKEERKLAQELSASHIGGGHKAGLTQSRQAVAESMEAMEARFHQRLAHEATMARDSKKVLAETARAREAVEDTLGDTDAGEEVGKLLRRAQVAMRHARRSEHKEAVATKREIRAERRLEHLLHGGH